MDEVSYLLIIFSALLGEFVVEFEKAIQQRFKDSRSKSNQILVHQLTDNPKQGN